MNKYNQIPNKYLIEEFKKYCDKKEFTCLEIGCNAGKNLKALHELYPNADYCGTDINRESLVQARKNFPSGTFYLDDITQLVLHTYCQFPTFDYILLPDVLEHLTCPDIVLRYIKKYLLKPDGKIFIGIPNLVHYTVMYNLLTFGLFTYTETGLLDCDHKHLFTIQEMQKMLEKEGFHINEIISIQDRSFYNDWELEFIDKLIAFSDGKFNDFQYKTFSWHLICSVDNEEKL